MMSGDDHVLPTLETFLTPPGVDGRRCLPWDGHRRMVPRPGGRYGAG